MVLFRKKGMKDILFFLTSYHTYYINSILQNFLFNFSYDNCLRLNVFNSVLCSSRSTYFLYALLKFLLIISSLTQLQQLVLHYLMLMLCLLNAFLLKSQYCYIYLTMSEILHDKFYACFFWLLVLFRIVVETILNKKIKIKILGLLVFKFV